MPGAEEAQEAVEVALGDEAGDANQSGLPALLLCWQVHRRHVTDRALACGDLQAPLLCNEMGHQTYLVGDLSAARPGLALALAIRRQAMGENHPDSAKSIGNLGLMLQAMDELPTARPYLKQVVAIAERSLGARHPNSPITRNNLEKLLTEMGTTTAPRACSEIVDCLARSIRCKLGTRFRGCARTPAVPPTPAVR